jgi:hypothetical protein
MFFSIDIIALRATGAKRNSAKPIAAELGTTDTKPLFPIV